jgi:prepilin-type N-terminal cleavage/methylation domain-containing protein
MTKRTAHARCGGFSLIELAVVLILLSVFSLIAGKLFTGTFHVIDDSRQAMRDIGEFEYAIRMMRTDVWAAQSYELVSPDRVEIKTSDGVRVLWVKHLTVTDDTQVAELIRTEYRQGESSLSHPLTAPVGLGFAADTHGLRLTTDTDTIVLTGVYLLLEEARP